MSGLRQKMVGIIYKKDKNPPEVEELQLNIIDLSHLINENIPVFPGTERPEIRPISSYEEHGFLEHEIIMTSHIGTHVDAPSHMIAGALSLDSMNIDNFCGSAVLLDCTHKNESDRDITIDDIADFESEICEADFVLINTGWYNLWDSNKYFKDYPALTAECASWLAGFNLKGVGVDVMSIDPPDTNDFPVHSIFLGSGMLIIENLTNLNALPKSNFIFSCMPLKFEGADGSPTRAIAFLP